MHIILSLVETFLLNSHVTHSKIKCVLVLIGHAIMKINVDIFESDVFASCVGDFFFRTKHVIPYENKNHITNIDMWLTTEKGIFI